MVVRFVDATKDRGRDGNNHMATTINQVVPRFGEAVRLGDYEAKGDFVVVGVLYDYTEGVIEVAIVSPDRFREFVAGTGSDRTQAGEVPPV